MRGGKRGEARRKHHLVLYPDDQGRLAAEVSKVLYLNLVPERTAVPSVVEKSGDDVLSSRQRLFYPRNL
jgi:hypothetical protein